MKKILLVISSLGVGGAQRAASNLTMNFPDDWGIDILVNSAKKTDYPYRGNLLSLGFEGQTDMSSLIFHARLLCRRVIRLRRLKKIGKYDACISFMDSANVANILSGNKYTKVIGSVRTSVRKCGEMSLKYRYTIKPLIKMLYNRSDAVVAVSSGVRRELIELGVKDEKVITIENGYNLSLMRQQANEPWDEKDNLLIGKKLVITAGRLSEEKAHWHLIRAFCEVSKKDRDAVLLILGTGPLENYLKQIAVKNGISDRVIFMGFVENPYKYIAKADMFVMPSLFEGYPNALAEAVCLGIPCIASDFHTGAREILDPILADDIKVIKEVYLGQYGILIPLCSGTQYEGKEELESAEIKMVNAMNLLLEDEEKKRYYAAKSVERSKDLGIESAIDQWMKLLI